ncbi:tetratricopeptide repeat protein, partial [Dyella sp. ASV21]|uniref:tetratricopeptide repeat protein n=1 Tax=Dyella sp. ASV21 TaxID=2795114 RepID=UPI001E44C9C2
MNALAHDSTPLSVEGRVLQARQLQQQGQHTQALALAQALALDVPENRDALYLVARSQRYLGRIDEALATLATLEQWHPGFSRLHEERGHCHVVRRDAPQAIEALLCAVNINPALPSSWNLLEGLYRMTGDATHASTAAAHVATLRRLAPEVVQATSLFSDGELAAAENIIRPYLLRVGHDIE